jgi:3-hydroxybutyryl-CoA dehydrogenase
VTISTVGVVGAGLMGSGIAQAAAMAGHDVLIHDSNGAQWNSARGAIEGSPGSPSCRTSRPSRRATW